MGPPRPPRRTPGRFNRVMTIIALLIIAVGHVALFVAAGWYFSRLGP